ncbi:tetratricopeptide repeat protein 16-like isoform X3 [Notolabrus celidotus]|uniref:tetratricopeptide repeat protein 16-like isoform X3 n=1 Tax=Notolabrus celidotus TaxID=1203425 RepID=UPI0014900E01|nr:tetratricopeptide repeat protein 16-like isoform X3 [Notolabrus celidotus]
METSEGIKDRTQVEEQSLFSGAAPEEEQEEAGRRSTFRRSFGSSEILQEKQSQRSELQGSFIIQSRAAEHIRNGGEAMRRSQYEKAVICFSKAITLQPEETRLHVSQAEAYLQLCDFQSAAASYKRAWRLEPEAFRDRLAFIYYLQGQCLFDRGLYFEALEAFSKAAEVKPSCRAYEVRSLACLSATGLHADCLKMVDDWILSDSPTSDLYVLRARLNKQLNQTSQSHQDVMAALALTPACPQAAALLQTLQEAGERARQKAVDRLLTGQLPEALCMINIALENCPQDPQLYLFRGILYRRLRDFTAAIEDLVHSVELGEKEEEEEEEEEEREVRESISLQEDVQFQLVLTYNDFAVQCFSRGLYAEATLLLTKAIEEGRGPAGLYLNRGDCFFKQGEWSFALADYQQAEEMTQPDDPAVRLRLAVIHNTLGSLCFQNGCFQKAADMFSLAVRYNPTAGLYYENRSKAFRKLLNFEGARKDLISLLILDPTNEELPPMLMSLFPGCSESHVLSSPAAQAVRAQLMETIQACSSSSDQQRLSEKLQEMTLSGQDSESQSEEPLGAGEELRLCLNKLEMKMFVKSVLQVLQGGSRAAERYGSNTVTRATAPASGGRLNYSEDTTCEGFQTYNMIEAAACKDNKETGRVSDDSP